MGSVGQPRVFAGGSGQTAVYFVGRPGRAAVCPIATLIGNVGEFDASCEEWTQYAERLAHFLLPMRLPIKTE